MASKETYLSYWIHKVDQLWKEMEDIKKRLAVIEAKLEKFEASERVFAANNALSASTGEKTPNVPSITVTQPQMIETQRRAEIQQSFTQPKKEQVAEIKPEESVNIASDPVVAILRQRGPLSLVDINNALKSMGIEESLRDTLFNRLKKLMQAGVVAFDESNQLFYLRG